MGAHTTGPNNPRTGLQYKRKTNGTCSDCMISMFLPPVLKALILSVLPKRILVSLSKRETVCWSMLHPKMTSFVASILESNRGTFNYDSPEGGSLRVAVFEPVREADDFLAELRLQMDGQEVFNGSFRVFRAYQRGKTTFLHSVTGGIEILYDHMLQLVYLEQDEVHMRIGAVEVTGRMSRPEVVKKVLESTIMRSGVDPDPGFDPNGPFGLFPDEGFEYFYGDGFVLEDTPLQS